jgi:hypothetical protein
MYPRRIGRTLITKHPFHRHHDSGLHDESSDELVCNGSIAAAEFDRMRKEIETLKEALHDSRKASKRQMKVQRVLSLERISTHFNRNLKRRRSSSMSRFRFVSNYTVTYPCSQQCGFQAFKDKDSELTSLKTKYSNQEEVCTILLLYKRLTY